MRHINQQMYTNKAIYDKTRTIAYNNIYRWIHIYIEHGSNVYIFMFAFAVFQRHDISLHQAPTPNIGFSKVSIYTIDVYLSCSFIIKCYDIEIIRHTCQCKY